MNFVCHIRIPETHRFNQFPKTLNIGKPPFVASALVVGGAQRVFILRKYRISTLTCKRA